MGTNTFHSFLALIEPLKADNPEAEFEVSEPALQGGFWILAIDFPNGFSIEVEWKRPFGFGIVAGYDFDFGSGVHEIYSTPQDAAARVQLLASTFASTRADLPISISELRKLRGRMQKDVAQSLGITKGGLAQIEASAAEGKIQVDTLCRLISSLGGRLTISALFPDGMKRRVRVG